MLRASLCDVQLRSTQLPTRLHVADLVGADLARAVDTSLGEFVRLNAA